MLQGDTGTAKLKSNQDKTVATVRVVTEEASPTLEGERKTVTALFADIKGSTELEQDLDPEEARAIVDPALRLMIDAVQRYDGYIVQSTGDGIFALFGAPVAHEDHPQRALYAALRMQEELKKYSARLREAGNAPLEARVGVNSGEVVIRSITTGAGHTEYTPIGHTANLASRMQVLAPTGSIAISEQTRALVEGYFALKPLGPTRVKGVSEPVNVYEVTGLGPLRTRLQRSAGRGFTKFVGRNREMDAMKAAAEQAKAGHGQIVAAMAEAGVGKSRLIFEFKATSAAGWMVLEAFSVSHGKASSYAPVIDLLHSYFKIVSQDDQRTRREKIAGRIAILDRSLEDVIPYLHSLLGIAEASDPLAQIDAQTRKRRTLDAIKRILLRESLNQALMVIFEDLHWVDESTQAFLNLLADSIGTAKVLLLVNYRPEYSHQWNSKTYYTQLRLDPLGKESAAEMLSALLGDGKDLAPLKRLIIERTEGNPFFMEETVLVLFDDGALVRNGTVKLTKSLNELKIPPTVQAILAARIDRLAPGHKDLLQTLAVIGKEFKLGLVRRVAANPEPELEPMLSELQLGEFIYEQPAVGDIEYTFKHALTRDVAYNSVLNERRRMLHGRIGPALESMYADNLDDHVAELAHHYSRSDNSMRAASYLNLAAVQAGRRLAFKEAAELAERGVSILASTADGPERDRQEIGLQIILAKSLQPTFSPGFVEVGRAYTRAMELCGRIGDERQLFPALVGLNLHFQIRAEGQRARELTDQLLAMAVRQGHPAMVGTAHALQAASLLSLGQPEAARAHGEASLAVPGPEDQFGSEDQLGPVFQRFASAFPALSCSLWLLGFPDRARRVADESISRARALKSPLATILSLTEGWNLNRFLRDAVRTREHAEAAIAIGSEYGIRPLELAAIGHRAWSMVYEGRAKEGLEGIRRLVEGRDRLGMGSRPSTVAMLVEAHLQMKQPVAGLRALEDAFSRVEPTGERMYESELYRLKGELLLAQDASNAAQAEKSFRTAIEIAQAQSAKSWELRATTSLAGLLAKQGKRDEARAMLAEIYNWFTEGFDTADLKDAKALLEDLEHQAVATDRLV
ncbi:MAG TPA: adenylate/guanylate cyclase domain-containing protein [Candidatus Binataceae bacterium]|nr:adenylate/guanylate cyclase domain-containing protein [Candidatus Binataceae bacterium]